MFHLLLHSIVVVVVIRRFNHYLLVRSYYYYLPKLLQTDSPYKINTNRRRQRERNRKKRQHFAMEITKNCCANRKVGVVLHLDFQSTSSQCSLIHTGHSTVYLPRRNSKDEKDKTNRRRNKKNKKFVRSGWPARVTWDHISLFLAVVEWHSAANVACIERNGLIECIWLLPFLSLLLFGLFTDGRDTVSVICQYNIAVACRRRCGDCVV